MKKIVFVLALLTGCGMLDAANPVTLTKGDVSVFSEDVLACVVIDDHKTIIDGKDQTADVYYGEKSSEEYEKFVSDVDRGHESFITYFNEKKKSKTKLTLGDSAEGAAYTLTVNVASMNVGNGGGIAWGMSRKAGGALINGTMQLVDNSTGNVVCEFEFERVKGLLSPVFRARVVSVYRYLADGLLKAVQ